MEQQSEYRIGASEQEDSINNARAMIGWDQEPSVSVEPPKRTMKRHGKKMYEVEESAFVKFSTAFKTELADLDVYALKVFIYIGLSIGYDTGTAFPGVRKIAKETKMDKDTVIKAIAELEQKGFLSVYRRDGNSNIYRPECYFAIGEGVPSHRTVEELSDEEPELSDENTKLSPASRVKHTQQDKQDFKQEDRDTPAAQIFRALENLMGALNTSVPRYVDAWLEKHTVEWIFKAIETAKEKGARSEKYIDKILIGWEANGYPKSRDEQIKERRGNSASTRATPKATDYNDDFMEQLAAKKRRLQEQMG